MITEYETKIQITEKQTGKDGLLKLSELFMIFQNIAGAHADILGCGYNDLIRKGLFFAITNARADIKRLPAAGERLVLKTCIGKVSHMFCPRYYMLFTEAEELLAEAAVRWVLMDVEKRVAVSPADAEVFISGDKNPWQLKDAGAVKPSETSFEGLYTVSLADLDVNEHMNNTKYYDAACSFIEEHTDGFRLSLVAMEYRNELLFGQTMKLAAGIDVPEASSGSRVFYIEGNTEEKTIFRMRLTYNKK